MILTPNCPVCSSPPLYAFELMLPWFCPNDECLALAWDPREPLEKILMDAKPVTVTELRLLDDPEPQ